MVTPGREPVPNRGVVRIHPWAASLVVGGGLICVYLLTPARSWIGSAVFVFTALVATIGVAVGTIRNRPDRARPWWVLFAGLVVCNAANLIWRAYLSAGGPGWMFPLSDAVYLTGYLLLVVGTSLLIRGRTGGRDRAGLLDAAVVTAGLAVLAWTFLLRPIALDADIGTVQRLVALAYPTADLMLLAMVVRLLTTRGARNGSYALLVASVVMQLTTDIGFVLLQTTDLRVERAADVGWLLAYVLFAASALHPKMVTIARQVTGPPRFMTRGRFTLLVGASLLAPATLAAQGVRNPASIDWPGLTLGSIALFLLVLARMWNLIGQVQNQARQLESMARVDSLTGVLNRRGWEDDAPRHLAHAAQVRDPVHVAIVDLDHFKRYNDRHGHPAGDALLRDTTDAWRAQLRAGDVLARYGGEEFVLLLAPSSAEVAVELLVRMRSVTPDRQSFSAGLARWDGVESLADVVARADRALYTAKRGGRDRIELAPGCSAAARPAGHTGPAQPGWTLPTPAPIGPPATNPAATNPAAIGHPGQAAGRPALPPVQAAGTLPAADAPVRTASSIA